VILHRIREGFSKVFRTDAEKLEMNMFMMLHTMSQSLKSILLTEKGKRLLCTGKARQGISPKSSELAKIFKTTGQPVIIAEAWKQAHIFL